MTITVGNTAPTATIITPAAGTTWKVGDVITFSGSATDPQDGTLPPSALTWTLILHHCPSELPRAPVADVRRVASGSFTAPDHEYPSYLELRLTATDSGGLTDTKSVRLDPRTVTLTFQTTPGGLQLTVNGASARATFSRTVIVGSTNSISAPSPQQKGKKTYNSCRGRTAERRRTTSPRPLSPRPTPPGSDNASADIDLQSQHDPRRQARPSDRHDCHARSPAGARMILLLR